MELKDDKKSLADDPELLAGLAAIDHGLATGTIPRAAKRPPIDLKELASIDVPLDGPRPAPSDMFADLVAIDERIAQEYRQPPRLPVELLDELATIDQPLDRFPAHTVADLTAAIAWRAPVILVTGRHGAGKTTMCRGVAGRLDRSSARRPSGATRPRMSPSAIAPNRSLRLSMTRTPRTIVRTHSRKRWS
jgi:hypothetical protein